jgi:nicotinamide phosphoribosyltransferase
MQEVNLNNICLMADAYKIFCHWQVYPKDTQVVYSYLESRGGKFDSTMFFGLQMILQRNFVGKVLTQEMINEAEPIVQKMGGTFNRQGWEYILKTHGGKLPVRIKAVKEGSVVPVRNVLLTMENTDENVPWLTNYLETILMQSWYPQTVATLSYHTKELIRYFAQLTGSDVSPYHLHDFGYRGVSSRESAGLGGAAHLMNFKGTDTLEGLMYAKKYYNAQDPGHSVPATEHSTTTIFGPEHELDAYKHFIRTFPTGILSVVIDSYNMDGALNMICGPLRDMIRSRKGKLVCRPDSGVPKESVLDCLNALWSGFGGSRNSNGYKVLDPSVGVIQGDGINFCSIQEILSEVVKEGYSTDNVVFGQGGGLLQQVDRDTQRFAFKCSAAKVNNEWIDVFKNPKTDVTKASKKGRLKLVKINNEYATVGIDHPLPDELVTVFENGNLVKKWDWSEIASV